MVTDPIQPERLLRLLRGLYSREDFLQVVSHDEVLQEIQYDLPGTTASANEFFHAAVEIIFRRNLLEELRRAVIQSRPMRKEEVNEVFYSWGDFRDGSLSPRLGGTSYSTDTNVDIHDENSLRRTENASLVMLGVQGALQVFFVHTVAPWAIDGLDALVLTVGPTGTPGELARSYMSMVPSSAVEQILASSRVNGGMRPEEPRAVRYRSDVPGPREVILVSAYPPHLRQATLDGAAAAAAAVFRWIKETSVRRLAFPLLGTGGGGLNEHRVAVAQRIIDAAKASMMKKPLELYIFDQGAFSADELTALRNVLTAATKELGEVLGKGLEIQREASKMEGALDVERYAGALTELFSRAGADFTFGLFGPWGRGKTYLMRRVAEGLQRDHRYETVRFSAWAYPQTPVLWAHLYECVAERALACSWWRGVGRSLRAGLARRGTEGGVVGIYVALLGFGLGVVSFGVWFSIAKGIYALVGLAGLFMLVRVARRGSEFGRRLRKYLMLPRYDEHLGLQAVIGRDLKALLVGWLPDSPPVSGGHAALLLLLCLGVTAGLFPWTYAPWSGTWWLGAGLAVLWLIVAITLGGLALASNGSPRRVLLVVDDLDRCEPSRMLEVIENLRLFIETQGVGERMQVAMLVDETALRLALISKYRGYGAEAGTGGQLLEESVEKLFLAYLRLPPLTGDDLTEVADKYFGELRRQQGRKGVASSTLTEPNVPITVRPSLAGVAEGATAMATDLDFSGAGKAVAAVVGGDQRPAAQIAQAEVKVNSPIDVFTFSRDEEVVLRHELRALVELRGGRVGPRTVRSILFRYQLARLLLERVEQPFGVMELAAALVGAHGKAPVSSKEGPAYRIVCQVCLPSEDEGKRPVRPA